LYPVDGSASPAKSGKPLLFLCVPLTDFGILIH
jgi:hypothetical protein